MWIEFHGENMKPIFDSIHKMAKTGFDVELHRDWYSEINYGGDFVFLPPTRFVSKERKLHRMWVYGFTHKRLDILEDAGAKIIPTNVPKNLTEKATSLFRGRGHDKILYIKSPDRMVAWVGGMNLAEEHFRMIDFMIKFDDPRIVQPLIDEFHRVGENKRQTNAEIRATDDTTILVDTGKEESLIMQQAIKDVDSAQRTIYISSAFLPSGEFLKALVWAKNRGVHISHITTNPDVVKGLWGLQGKLSDLKNRRKSKIPVMFPEKALVHAKALVVDEKSVIFGSHNFADMPHEELSLRSTNLTLVKNITGFLREVIKGNLDRKLDKDFIIPDTKAA